MSLYVPSCDISYAVYAQTARLRTLCVYARLNGVSEARLTKTVAPGKHSIPLTGTWCAQRYVHWDLGRIGLMEGLHDELRGDLV